MNAKTPDLIIFHPKKTKLDYSLKFKLSSKKLNSFGTVRYLGILLDEHLLWTKQVNWVNSNLNQTIGILSKLRYNTSLLILRTAYHSLFGSHVQYGTQLWGQGYCVNQNNIQNRALRKITFKKLNDPVNPCRRT